MSRADSVLASMGMPTALCCYRIGKQPEVRLRLSKFYDQEPESNAFLWGISRNVLGLFYIILSLVPFSFELSVRLVQQKECGCADDVDKGNASPHERPILPGAIKYLSRERHPYRAEGNARERCYAI